MDLERDGAAGYQSDAGHPTRLHDPAHARRKPRASGNAAVCLGNSRIRSDGPGAAGCVYSADNQRTFNVG